MHWLIDEHFAQLPELVGHVPLAVAFAQFVAVECVQDPSERDELAQDLRRPSCAQQVMRWMVRLLQAGELRASGRPLGGGAAIAMPVSHWHADDVAERFVSSRYSRATPFDVVAKADSWIFLNEDDLERLWNERKEQRLGIHAAPQQRRPRAVTMPPAARATVSPDTKLLGLAEVQAMIGLGRSTIYKMIDENTFPSQLKIGGRSLWHREDVEAWITSNRGLSAGP